MSTLIISWDDEKIVEIEKRGELFYSSVNYENVLRAKEKGFPVSLLKQISVVSDELAPVIKRRIPNPKTLNVANRRLATHTRVATSAML